MAIPFTGGDALTVRQIRELDVLAIEHVGIPGLLLMENAGRTIAECIHGLLPQPEQSRVVVLAGGGNNGGDGFVTARHLDNAGVAVTTFLAIAPARIRGDAATNLGILQRLECRVCDLSGIEVDDAADAPDASDWREVAIAIKQADIVVDALLGTGATGAPRGVMAALIQCANLADRPRRVAIDIPSGLAADDGVVHDPCFRADLTVTLAAPKIGFGTRGARDVLGRVIVADVGIPRKFVPNRATKLG